MSKRKDLESLRKRMGLIPLSVAGPAWELGRIAGIREAARKVLSPIDSKGLRYYARKLKQRLK